MDALVCDITDPAQGQAIFLPKLFLFDMIVLLSCVIPPRGFSRVSQVNFTLPAVRLAKVWMLTKQCREKGLSSRTVTGSRINMRK